MGVQAVAVRTNERSQFVDITPMVRRYVADSGVGDGMCYVFVPHTTAAVTINEAADPSVKRDIIADLDRLVPRTGAYTHAEGNSAAHIKATMVGSSVCVPVSEGDLVLGTWQGIYFCEFDGPRERRVHIRVLDS